MTTRWQNTLEGEDREKTIALLDRLFDLWSIPESDRIHLVGPDGAYAGVLLSIHRELRLLFPQNERLRYGWMTAQNADFDGRSPLEFARQARPDGVIAILTYLKSVTGGAGESAEAALAFVRAVREGLEELDEGADLDQAIDERPPKGKT